MPRFRNRNDKSVCFRGQNQEDRLLAEQGWVPERGVFVDVGAGDPSRYSNTLYLEEQGWEGLCIDADPRQVEALRRARSCSVEWAAVTSADREEVEFLQCDDPDYSTTSQQVCDAGESEGRKYTAIRVPGMRLETILEKHGVGRIDLLSIDVEGAELDVCKSLDWQRHRPAAVVIEHSAAGAGSQERELRNYFAAMPYRLVQWTPENLILVESRLPRFLLMWSPRALLAKRKWHARTVVGHVLHR
jgi:FkbM family methyltransferase